MTGLLLGFMMILFISGPATTQDLESAFEIIKKIVEWGMKIYETIEKQRNPDKSKENIEMIMKQVEEVSSKLDALETHLDIKLDSMLNTLLDDIELENSLNTFKAELRHCFNKIDRYFDESRDYKLGGSVGNETLRAFSHKTLWSTGSVPDFLNDMHDIFFPDGALHTGFLDVMLERSMLNLLHDCNTDVSPQQKVYYIYIQLFITEVKGLVIQQQSHMIERWLDITTLNHTSELNMVITSFQTRVKDYGTLFMQAISQFPQHLRRCEGNPPERGVNFVELLKFSRISILDTDVVNSHCTSCPEKSTLERLSKRTNTTITDCKNMGTTITACPAESGSPHDYLWLQDGAGKHYGPNTSCAKTKTISGGYNEGFRSGGSFATLIACHVCACSMETNNIQNNYESAIWRISVTDQISDIWNNKVVTGVKLVTHDNALHLQIQQARFTHNGMIYNGSNWKELELGYFNGGMKQVKQPMVYEPLRHDRNSIYLDDIEIPDGYAVTGVRFKLVDNVGFKLQILASEFDLVTGDLFPYGDRWFDASISPIRPDDYKRPRMEINMGASNDPTRASEFKYALETNKLVKFTHTDFDKDAGQTTIPLLDAQSVEARPSFPLSGVGLYFRGRDGFGGYIAPRIYTLDVTHHMGYPDFSRNNQSTTTKILPTSQEASTVNKRSKPEYSGSPNDACC